MATAAIEAERRPNKLSDTRKPPAALYKEGQTMARKTKIQWTEATWNPIVGCTKCSPGCLNCYAERMAYRLACMGIPYYDEVNDGNWTNDVITLPASLDKPLHWRKPRKVFVCSMSDLFHPKVPFEFIDKVMGAILQAPQHTYQALTKRPQRMLEWAKHYEQIYNDFYHSRFTFTQFQKRIWLGVTVCTQKEADEKIPILLQIPAAVRFVSIEPMLEGIDFKKIWCCDWDDYNSHGWLDWVIVGAESGPKRRECKYEWVDSVVAQCEAANVPCFVKQIHNQQGKLVKMPAEFPQEYPKE